MGTEPWVNASEVGQAKFCPHSLYLQKHGFKPNREASIVMRKGTQQHARSAQKAIVVEDKRCYIATALYGVDHPNTIALRQWRDTHLTPQWWGRLITNGYYGFSPLLTKCFGHTRTFRRVVKWLIKRITGIETNA